MSRLALIAVLAAACGKSAPAPAAKAADAGVEALPGPVLPGRIWFTSARGLERLEAGKRTVVAPQVYASGARLGARLVAIRSRGDGSADGEQLVLIDGDAIAPLGFRAAQVRDPAVDPAGQWIVVAATREGHSELYRIDVATGADTRLTTNAEGNFRPAALDTATIAFVSSRDGDAELYRMPVAGGAPVRLTAFHRDDWAPTPSPDGKTLAFVSDREGRPRIFVMAPDGTGLRRLTARTEPDVDEIDPVWSPDGSAIAYVAERTSGGAIVVHTLATHAERALGPPGVRDAAPAFSPDGAWIVAARGAGHDVDLWAYPLAPGATPVQISADAGAETVPRWFPLH